MLGPIGRHSRRPALMATAVAAAMFGFLPEESLTRVVCTLALVLLAEAAVRLGAPWPEPGAGDPEPVIDRCAGMWCALLPLPRSLPFLLVAFALFHLLTTTQRGPVAWASRVAGGQHHVADDVMTGLMVGAAVSLISNMIYML